MALTRSSSGNQLLTSHGSSFLCGLNESGQCGPSLGQTKFAVLVLFSPFDSRTANVPLHQAEREVPSKYLQSYMISQRENWAPPFNMHSGKLADISSTKFPYCCWGKTAQRHHSCGMKELQTLRLSWSSCVLQRAPGQGIISLEDQRGTRYDNWYPEGGGEVVQQKLLYSAVMQLLRGLLHYWFNLKTELRATRWFAAIKKCLMPPRRMISGYR